MSAIFKPSLIGESAWKWYTDGPLIRLASGTLTPNNLTDLAAQVAICDPTIFGDEETFNERYGENSRGGKVTRWKASAAVEVHRILKQNTCFIQVKRKEWAALLPELIENFHLCEFTPRQSAVYQAILQETIEAIKNDESLMEILEGKDEEEIESIAELLRPYLARLDAFLTAPDRDPLGDKLDGDDRRSPKLNVIVEICRDHLKRKLPGKIIIFTTNVAPAESIYEQLPADLKSKTVLYRAATQVADLTAFAQDPNIQILLGCGQSLAEGHNLQYASRLVRLQIVWTPGEKEQGESRVVRPQHKEKDKRTNVFVDWVLVDQSIDVAKISRLIAKTITVAKFENQDSVRYQNLPELDLIPMSLEVIQNSPYANFSNDYVEAYAELRRANTEEFLEFRNNPKNRKENVHPKKGSILKGSKLLKHVPYIPGMTIYGEGELGLVPWFNYENEHTKISRRTGEPVFDWEGLVVHTEYGEGEVEARYLGPIRALDSHMHARIELGISSVTVCCRKRKP
jgi:hypothetical protein